MQKCSNLWKFARLDVWGAVRFSGPRQSNDAALFKCGFRVLADEGVH